MINVKCKIIDKLKNILCLFQNSTFYILHSTFYILKFLPFAAILKFLLIAAGGEDGGMLAIDLQQQDNLLDLCRVFGVLSFKLL